MLDQLDGGLTEDLPQLPLHLPGLKRSSFLASQTQLHNMVRMFNLPTKALQNLMLAVAINDGQSKWLPVCIIVTG